MTVTSEPGSSRKSGHIGFESLAGGNIVNLDLYVVELHVRDDHLGVGNALVLCTKHAVNRLRTQLQEGFVKREPALRVCVQLSLTGRHPWAPPNLTSVTGTRGTGSPVVALTTVPSIAACSAREDAGNS